MNEKDIEKFGKGALHTEDVRDFAFGATTPFDWSKPIIFNKPLPISNQNGSSSCVGQSTMNMGKIFYYDDAQKMEDFSARFIYSQIFLPSGGAYLRDGIATLLKDGIALNADFPSDPQTEAHMRDKTGLDEALGAKYDIYPNDLGYALIGMDIDSVAAGIRDETCVMIGVIGDNAGWTQADVQVPQSASWGHAIVGVGAEIRNGKKVIKFINSWGNGWGDNGYGYLSEDYFASHNILACYTITNNFIKPMLTLEQVKALYALWGMSGDTTGISFWGDGTHSLDELLKARVADEVTALQALTK